LKPATLARLRRASLLCDAAMMAVGVLMVLYVGIAVFGLVPSSARHYAAFMLFVMVMSSFAAFKVIIGERFGLKVIDEGYAAEASAMPAKTPVLVWIRAALASMRTN